MTSEERFERFERIEATLQATAETLKALGGSHAVTEAAIARTAEAQARTEAAIVRTAEAQARTQAAIADMAASIARYVDSAERARNGWKKT
jgi:septal ring factor EnvC (AmiA/AmiB activator)